MIEDITAKDYFDTLKAKKQNITTSELNAVYDNCLVLMEKYVANGQVTGAKKLMFHLETIEREKVIVSKGIDTFVYKDDIEYYIDKVAGDAVKTIELERYEREIPDHITALISDLKGDFDQMYVLFTDYTGFEERKALVERKNFEKEKDPILFGVFRDEESATIIERFYFIGDWEDEYCDLTLDKMVSQMKADSGNDVRRKISTPQSLEDLKKQLQLIDSTTMRVNNPRSQDENIEHSSGNTEKSFLATIKSLFVRPKSKKDKR